MAPRHLVLLLVALCALRAAPAPVPKLVVVLVIDQMPTGYVDRYQHQWTRGLRRLVDEGAWFHEAAYPYLNTVTCTGHATISTGTFPSTHGMVLNGWWDRGAGKLVPCTDDPETKPISYSHPVSGNSDSPAKLQTSTLSDALRTQLGTAARVVTVALKPRSSVMLAGHRADSAVWFDDEGAWVTSSAFASAPVPVVQEFVERNPVERDAGKTWTRRLDASAYLFDDAAPGEGAPRGWTPSFPHVLPSRIDSTFYRLWQVSPFADEYVGQMTAATVEGFQLGRRGTTDFLGVSFSSLDLAGHQYGPRSHEVQDVLVRLDATIGDLLDHLDRTVGRGMYALALTSDHGVSPIPEQMAQQGLDAGRISTARIVEKVEGVLARTLGSGKHVASMQYTDLYFVPGVYEKLAGTPGLLNAVIDTIRAMPGIARVYRGDELQKDAATDDTARRAAMRSYYPGRSGDLIAVPRPYWIVLATGTTHGTSNEYDTRVPLILFGQRIRPGEYLEPATPADIAPTLAFLSGVTLPRRDGRVLAEALARPAEAERVRIGTR